MNLKRLSFYTIEKELHNTFPDSTGYQELDFMFTTNLHIMLVLNEGGWCIVYIVNNNYVGNDQNPDLVTATFKEHDLFEDIYSHTTCCHFKR